MAREKHEREVFRLPDLLEIATEPGYVIANRTFDGCNFHGPAVFVFITDVNFNGNNIRGSLEAVLWEIAPPRTQVVGAFGLRNCDVLNCSFEDIGFAGPPEFIRDFRRAS
jgi:hypothetical protein